MNKKNQNGLIISLEGIEGCGKSTQIALFQEYLESLDYEILLLREPGGTVLGEQIRNLLLALPVKTNALTEALLFAASRTELINQKIIPFLDAPNKVVLLDRFIDSSFIYQGYAGELGIQAIEKIHSAAPLDLRPDLSFYYRISLETSFKRQEARGNKKDYFESKPREYYQKLIDGFDMLAKKYSERIKVLDAEKNPQEIFKSSQSIFEQFKS